MKPALSRASNVAVEYRWADDQFDRLPELAADLIRRGVAVIAPRRQHVTRGGKGVTKTIPIVFTTAWTRSSGLVASLNRPGGNVTGVSLTSSRL